MRKLQSKITSLLLIALLVFGGILPFLNVQIAYAAALLNKSDTMSTLKITTLSNHAIFFRTPSGAQGGATPDTITVTFPAGFAMGTFALLNFDLGATTGGQTTCTPGLSFTERTLAATNGVDIWGVAQSGQVVTFTSASNAAGASDLATNACIRVRIGNNAVTGGAGANQITNPGTANPYTISISGNAGFGDSGDLVVQILADDQVAVSGTVVETMTFAILDISIGFGNLTASNARFASGDGNGTAGPTSASAHTMTMATNAASGYSIRYNGATLTCSGCSGSPTISVATITGDEDGVPASEQFAIGFTTNGNATIVSAYNQVSPTFNYSFVASTETEVISETVPTTTETFSAFYLANITGATEAGSYTTAITYTATANF